MTKSFRRYLARHRRNRAISYVARRTESYIRGYNNYDYDCSHNGEAFLIRNIVDSGRHDGVFFDVGANKGDWSALVRQYSSTAHIHAFEIVPTTAADLKDRFKDDRLTWINDFGLGSEKASVEVRTNQEDSTRATTLASWDPGGTVKTIECDITSGDAYCLEQDISHIDFLKIDAEGGEPEILEGFADMIKRGQVDVIQFEYGRANLVNRFFLSDFYEFFDTKKYAIGKLFPNYVEFAEYSHAQENFLGPNYVAVKRPLTSLIKTLSGQ